MYLNKKIVLVFVALVSTILACNFSSNPCQPPEGLGAIFWDDFSDTDCEWDQSEDEQALTDFQDGGYRIFVKKSNYSAWANPNESSNTDVRVEADALKNGGDDDNEFGLICRHVDAENFYVATISSDGYYGFLRRLGGGDIELIGMESMLSSDAVQLGGASNHIRLDCVGSILTLYVNGEMVGQASDSALTNGDVGLYAGTFEIAGTDILFDNFVVYQP